MSLNSFEKSKEMFLRATKVIPSGISGHKNPSFGVPGSFPYFAERGEGCRYVDVDGNEYIDFLCGYGPIVLGYSYKKIDAAADAQRALGSAFNHPTPRTLELAEKLVELIPCADWAAFGRNGSDVTTYAIQIAREYTQRRKIIVARGAYHGSHAWCTPGHGGLLYEDQLHVLPFTWNDANEVEALVQAHEGDVAAVILTPYHHPAFALQELPTESFWPDVRRICDSHGVILICDDIRAGFRLHMRCSREYFGVVPYMMSYFIESTNAIDHMMKTGEMLKEGLRKRADAHGLQIQMTGPATLPFMTFANERNFRRSQCFSAECAMRGVLLHPHHNWFMMYSHEEADVQQALDVADEAFGVVKQEFGG
jgi:glutamate-1-semialdehyde 2,1-aminomutase